MEIKKVLQDGSMFDPAVLDLSSETIIKKFQAAVDIQSKLSLGIGYSTTVSAPHTLLNGFKNLVAFSCASGYEFAEAQAFLSAAANAPGGGTAAAASGTAAAAEAAPAEEAEKEEDEDVEMGNLFGDDDDY